jgi:hypothetical protein
MAEIRVNSTGAVKLFDNDDSHFVGLQAGSVSSNVTFTLPTADGSDGQFLKTDGSGALSFGSVSSALDDITTGDAASTLATSAGNITIDAQGNDTDIIFKGTDGSSDTTFLTIDGSDAGTLIANHNLELGTDSSEILFGADNEVKVIHNADKGLILKHTATADDKPVILTLQTGETDMAANDVIGKIEFQAPDESTGTDAILVSGAIQAVAEGDHSSSSNATRLEFMTGASEAATSQMTISSGGIVGIGAGVPGDLGVGLHIKTADSGGSADAAANQLILENSGHCGIGILSGTSSESNIYFGDSGSANIGYISYNHNGNYMGFAVSGNEAFRLTSDKDLNFGSGQLQLLFDNSAATTTAQWDRGAGQGGNTSTALEFKHGGSTKGSIGYDDGSTSYNTSSDYRLKENVNYTFDATTRLKQLKPARFNFKVHKDESGNVTQTMDGFLAHEISSVVPEAVTGAKDAVDSDGEIIIQQLDQAKLIPLLVKTIQELETRVTTLEG